MIIERMADGSAALSAQGEDQELVYRAQQGDTVAFGKLITKYRADVLARIYSIIQNKEETLDLSQNAFVKVWQGIRTFEGKSSFYTWLYIIATREAIEWLRRIRPCFITLDAQLQSPVVHPDLQVQSNEFRPCVLDAVATLSPKHRAVIVLKDLENLNYSEIAKNLECSIGTVMSRLFYARQKLQIRLRPLYENLLRGQRNGCAANVEHCLTVITALPSKKSR